MRLILKVLLLTTALLTTTRSVAAQVASSGIQFVSAQQISIDHATHPHVESFIAVDSRDPQHLLAASMVMINGEMRSYPYTSFDGGKSWTLGLRFTGLCRLYLDGARKKQTPYGFQQLATAEGF